MSERSRFALLPLIILLAGCYTYTPVRPEAVPAGAPVRARITTEEAGRLREALGREDRVIEGTHIGEQNGGGYMLSVPAVYQQVGLTPQRFDQRVIIPPSELIELEIRTLNKWKTGGVVAAGVALGAVLVYSQFQQSDDPMSNDDKGTKNRGDAAVVPVFRIGR